MPTVFCYDYVFVPTLRLKYKVPQPYLKHAGRVTIKTRLAKIASQKNPVTQKLWLTEVF